MLALAYAWSGAAVFALSLLYFLYSYAVRFGGPAAGGGALAPVAIDVLLFTGFALHHSLFARSGAKTLVHRWVPPHLERATYTWVASVLFVVVCRWWQPVPGELYHLSGLAALPGLAAQAAGVLLTIRSSARLDVLELAGVRPVLDARRGTRVRSGALETRGLYGLVRHPLYLAWALLVFATPHMTMTRFVFALVSTAYLALAIPLEERGLVRTYGRDYEAYRQKVRWRMIPGLY